MNQYRQAYILFFFVILVYLHFVETSIFAHPKTGNMKFRVGSFYPVFIIIQFYSWKFCDIALRYCAKTIIKIFLIKNF